MLHIRPNILWVLSKNISFSITVFLLGYLSFKVQFFIMFLIGFIAGFLSSIYGLLGFASLLPHGIPEIIAFCLFAEEGYRYLKLDMKLRFRRIVIASILLIIAAFLESYVTPLWLEYLMKTLGL